MIHENVILVPIDSTEQTIIALGQSYNLAKLTKSKLVLLSVDEKNNKKAVEKKLDELAKDAQKHTGLPVETMIREGNVYEEINKVADVLNPLFVIIGLTSKISIDKLVGKNAFKMIRESKYPIISIRGKHHRDGCKNILVPLDLTKETREKVDNAIQLAKFFNADIRVVSVLSEKDEESENKLISYSNQVWKYIKEKGVRATIKTIRGTNIPEIVMDYAKEVDADLIMIMSKEKLNIKEFFTGTVAQQIINKSEIPVLTLRPMERKDTSVFLPY